MLGISFLKKEDTVKCDMVATSVYFLPSECRVFLHGNLQIGMRSC